MSFNRLLNPDNLCAYCDHPKREHFDYVEQDLGPGWGERFTGCSICTCPGYSEETV